MIEEIFSAVIVLIIIFIFCSCLGIQWSPDPYKEYTKIVKQYGYPEFINSSKNGAAVWNKFGKDSPFVRLMIIDENIPHETPQHHDFIYATIKYHIDPKKLMDVLNISDSIMYDRLKEELTVRCRSLENVMATLVLADAVHRDLTVGDYKEYIMDAKKKSSINYRLLQGIKDIYERTHS